MTISAADVKLLRDRTGAGMMECKKALVEAAGDLDAAVEILRKSGQAKADKKASRVAAEGRVVVRVEGSRAVIVEVNCETDFVANDANFREFADQVATLVLMQGPADVPALMGLPTQAGNTLEQARAELISKVGENITVRRFQRLESADGLLGSYVHGVRIGVLIELSGGDVELARDLSMHIAASNPMCVSADQVPAQTLEKEREILLAVARQEGKPEAILQKMVEGRVRKYLAEVTLLGQPFVKDLDTTVEKLLQQRRVTVRQFVRYEVGEGIEKKTDDFATEVMNQVRGR